MNEKLAQQLAQLKENPDIALLLEMYQNLEHIYSESLVASGLKKQEPTVSVVNTTKVTLTVNDISSSTR